MTPLVLLPGMMCDARVFTPQIEALSATVSLLLPSLTEQDTVASLARGVLDIAPERFSLAGLSMGGIVAMEILRQAPQRVLRPALLDTNPLAETQTRRELRDAQIKRVEDGDLVGVMRDEMKPHYLVDGLSRGPILECCMDMALGLGKEVFVRQSRALRNRRDQCDTLTRVKMPTLLLCGEGDRLCPPERHHMMHQLMPHGTLEVIPDAGHLPTLEQPELTTAAIRRWMEK